MLDIYIENNITIARFKNLNRFNYTISQSVKDDLNSILRNNNKKLIIDFKGIEFVDSSAIGALISVLKTSKEIKGSLYLCNVSAEVMDLFEVMQLHTVFNIYATKEEVFAIL